MKPGSQEYDTLQYLESGRTLTQPEAFFELGIGRLAAVVFNLRHEGYDIATEIIPVQKKNGRIAHVARYSLRGETDV